VAAGVVLALAGVIGAADAGAAGAGLGPSSTTSPQQAPVEMAAASAAAASATGASVVAPARDAREGPGALAPPFMIVSPTSGPPGTVISVTGRLMPANSQLTLSWSEGVQFTPSTVFTSDAGTFTAQAFVVPGDGFTGTRYLEVSSAFSLLRFDAVNPDAIASVPFLVTERPVQPPVPDAVKKLWGYLPFFFRP